MPNLDLRPATLNMDWFPGAAHVVTFDFGVSLAGRTFAARVVPLEGSATINLAVVTAGTQVKVTASEAQTATLVLGLTITRFELVETTGGTDQELIVGRVTATKSGGASSSTSVVLTSGAGTVTIFPLIPVSATLAGSGYHLLTQYGVVDTTGIVDATSVVNTALAAIYTNGGGTLMFPEGTIRIAGQIILPNDGGGIFPTGAQLQPPYVWKGTGAHCSGQNELGSGGTRLLVTFDGAAYNDAKIVTRGLGQFAVEDITFQDTTPNADTPFLYTTNTTLKVARCAFLGATPDTACQQDAIVLGGTIKHPVSATGYDNPDSAFQGYGTVIRECYFSRVRRVVYGRSYCNQVQIVDNFMNPDCGTNLVGGACIEFDGGLFADGGVGDGDYCTNNTIRGNYMEWPGGYYYMVKLRKATRCVVAYNGFIDPGPNRIAGVRCESHTDGAAVVHAAIDNLVLGNYDHGNRHLSEDTASASLNTLIHGGSSDVAKTILKETMKLTGAARLVIDTPQPNVADFAVTDLTTEFLKLTASSALNIAAPVTLVGNTVGGSAGKTRLAIGNNSFADTALLVFDTPAGQIGQIQFKRGGASSWLLYDANSTSFYIRDQVNGVMHLAFTPGSAVTGRVDVGVKLRALATAGIEMGSGGPLWRAGTGSPEGVVTAPIGSLWTRTDGGAATTLYVKESGAGNTGWTAK